MKTERIIAEIGKTKTKVAELQSKLRELERMKNEQENAEILELVRSIDVPVTELTVMLRAIREKSLAEAIKSQAPEIPMEQEDDTLEDEQ